MTAAGHRRDAFVLRPLSVSEYRSCSYDILLIAVGFALVAKGGDLFVDSSIHIGRALRIPRFVIGGTLVSLATTTPELVVSVTAASMGDSGIALGNAGRVVHLQTSA